MIMGLPKIDIMVLGLLAEKPMHGYEINQILTADEVRVWIDFARTSIYYSLNRLKKSGYVLETIERQSNKPEKNVFHISKMGREVFISALKEALGESEKFDLSYYIGLFFISKLSTEEAISVLTKRKEFLAKWESQLAAEPAAPAARVNFPVSLGAILSRTMDLAKAERKWIDKIMAAVADGRPVVPQPPGIEELSVMGLRGEMVESPLPNVIQLIAAGDKTGTLTMRRGPLIRALAFEQGAVKYAFSSARKKEVKKLSVGEAPGADRSVYSRVMNDIYEAVQWSDGTFVFEPDKLMQKDSVASDITTENLILESCRRTDDWSLIHKAIPSSAMVFEALSVEHDDEGVQLNDEENRVLSLANGIRSVEELADVAALSRFDAGKVLYGLSSVGLLAVSGTEKAELFGLARDVYLVVYERLLALMGKSKADAVEKELNLMLSEEAVPVGVEKGILTQDLPPGANLDDLKRLILRHQQLAHSILAKSLGKKFAAELIRSAINYLPEGPLELLRRHRFDETLLGET
jgi:DNA-binding PadR family transcriptional regulator